ncbi:MAG TPA: phytoene/squalene synthase family protein [Xanthobacteraceae bacterium]|jgi:phytoene synthase|nr:phytoene/squalene synthase family protein [Xanthobacteraceae bacterium]
MQDAFAYCAELVRTADRDRFLSSLFAPAEYRTALHALYAFNVEVTRVREVAREPLPGEIRLQWWSEVVNGGRAEEAAANPVASALLTVIERHRLAAPALTALLDARRFDLYDDPMARLADLETYARKTSSALLALAAQILGGEGEVTEPVANPAGIAHAIAGLLRAFPLHAARRQLYVPLELLDRHGVEPQDIFAGKSSENLRGALAELQAVARRHLLAAHQQIATLPDAAMSAFLSVALVRPALDRLARCDPFAPAELSPWRRQWLIWRAARNPERIAG